MSTLQPRLRAHTTHSHPFLTEVGYARHTRSRNQNKQRLLKRRLKFWLVLLIIFSCVGRVAWTKHVAAENLAAQKLAVQAVQVARQKAAAFDIQINQLIADNPQDTISVVVASDRTDLHTLGSTDTFDGASTGKLLTAADLLTHVETGTTSLSQRIDGRTAGTWLQKMIVNSDNNAWAELNGYLTHSDLAAYAHSIGFTDYNPDTNTFTSTDVAALLQKLYTGHLLKPADRELVLRYMLKANYRQYIVAAVPSGYTVYHKIGFDQDILNDVAIITHDSHYLVLAIYSDGHGSYDQASRTDLMHTITKDAIGAFL